MNEVGGLGVFPEMGNLPNKESEQISVLRSDFIRRVVCFSLGPEGTNIAQASRAWLKRMAIEEKSEVRLGKTPEECLRLAREGVGPGVLPVYWTCAVYAQESQFFFGNPDALPFFFQETMPLDGMQLATTDVHLLDMEEGKIPSYWQISSHPSPQHLLKNMRVRKIILVDSNAAAAGHCRDGHSDACITTESARKIYGLHTIHMFGSPPMIFFGGITPFGVELFAYALKTMKKLY